MTTIASTKGTLASIANLPHALIGLMNEETLNAYERPATVFALWALPPHVDERCDPNDNVET